MMYDNRLMKIVDIKKMSKPSLVMKIMRDSTQVQKNKMLRLVLKRMPKAMLVRLCVMVAKRNLPKLKLASTLNTWVTCPVCRGGGTNSLPHENGQVDLIMCPHCHGKKKYFNNDTR